MELGNKRPEAPGNDPEDTEKSDEQDSAGEMTGELKSPTVGCGTSALSAQQQTYVQYQHSYPYLHLCDPTNHAYRVMSPALVSSYAGKTTR